jgi:hypothetical protein
MYHERMEMNSELEIALSFNSVPLLSLALCRSHVCVGRENCCRNVGDHSLHEALEMRRLDAISLLLKHGSKELLREPCNGIRPLSRALRTVEEHDDTSYRAVELLLEHGADPNLGSGPNFDTALHQAAADGAADSVNLLLEFGANPNARNSDLLTPLHSLCQLSSYLQKGNKEKVVVLLLQHGADPTKLDKYGHRPADYLNMVEGPYAAIQRPSALHTEMTGRIWNRLLRASLLQVCLKLVLARGRSEGESAFCKLPRGVLETVARFL